MGCLVGRVFGPCEFGSFVTVKDSRRTFALALLPDDNLKVFRWAEETIPETKQPLHEPRLVRVNDFKRDRAHFGFWVESVVWRMSWRASRAITA